MSKGSARLGMAVQTVSAQVRELERDLGRALFKPSGRGIALTDAGMIALREANQLFQIGERLPDLLGDAVATSVVRFNVGVADNLPTRVVWQLLQPMIQAQDLRLQCQVDEFEDLLGDLALHRFDLVLADRPAPSNPNLRVYTHPLRTSKVSWYGAMRWLREARRGFPESLNRVPVILPTPHAAVRPSLERWFERVGVQPRVVAEFEDDALLETFGAAGMGAFPAVDLVHDDLTSNCKVERIGDCTGVEVEFFAIGAERKVVHPLMRRLIEQR